MRQIERHGIDVDNARIRDEKLAKIAEKNLAEVVEFPGFLESVQRKSLLRTRFRLAFDPAAESADTREALALSAQAGGAFFAAANRNTGDFDFTIRDRLILQATGPTIDHGAGLWQDVLWSAIICRDRASIVELCSVNIDTLRRSEGVLPEYVYSWVDTLQSYLHQKPDTLTKLNTALAQTDPDALEADLAEITLRQHYPPMPVLHYLATQKND